jgi:protein-tyrosine kinase
MSRIDEALKRASQGPLVGRIPAKRPDAPVRLGDEFALGDYPLESRSGNVRSDTPVGHPEASPSPPPRVQAAGLSARRSVDISQQAKLVVGSETSPFFLEQYRRLAAVLHDAQVEKGLKTVMVTSAVPKEGKTLTVTNLALTLSESYGRRVLLIDADLRKPSVHEVLGTPNDRGLSDLLRSDRAEPNIVAVSSKLSVLPAGSVRENPLAGLASARMRAFVDEIATRFDWVLLDAPPVGLLPDAQLLGRVAQAAVFVIRAGVTPYPVVDRAISELGRDCIIGTVLNGIAEDDLLTPQYYGYYQPEK